jgi:uncharacterized protein (DUF2252 family)
MTRNERTSSRRARSAAPAQRSRRRANARGSFRDAPLSERAAIGRSLRSTTPRSSHAAWEPPSDRKNPIALLEEQARERVAELVPIRYGRMSASPLAFFRGAACVMAADLAGTPGTGIRVQLCGDAHLSNFGGFASAERDLLFDLNDFDETLPGPWEWDVKRLAASVAVAGRANGIATERRMSIVRQAVGEYRNAIRAFTTMKTLDVWYARASVSDLRELLRAQGTGGQIKRLDKNVAKGQRKDSARAFEKLAVNSNGEARIRADVPLIVPVDDLLTDARARQHRRAARKFLDSYRASLSGDRRRLLERYRYVDSARKVVGVGSVGTSCWVMLLLGGRDSSDPLFLQAKEAQRSVLEPFSGESEFKNQGQRVVEGQRLMQAGGDIFLGWLHEPHSLDERGPRDFYIRQLWDSKISVDIAAMPAADMAIHSRICAWTLARAHARSGDTSTIAAYLGSSDTFDRAIAEFAEAYAEQNERDHAVLLDQIASGRVKVQIGL